MSKGIGIAKCSEAALLFPGPPARALELRTEKPEETAITFAVTVKAPAMAMTTPAMPMTTPATAGAARHLFGGKRTVPIGIKTPDHSRAHGHGAEFVSGKGAIAVLIKPRDPRRHTRGAGRLTLGLLRGEHLGGVQLAIAIGIGCRKLRSVMGLHFLKRHFAVLVEINLGKAGRHTLAHHPAAHALTHALAHARRPRASAWSGRLRGQRGRRQGQSPSKTQSQTTFPNLFRFHRKLLYRPRHGALLVKRRRAFIPSHLFEILLAKPVSSR